MPSVDCRTGFESLGRQECLWCLASYPIGRVAVVVEGWPVIVLVNQHVVDNDTIVFRSDELLKLTDPTDGPRMSLEADGIDDAGRLWSVTANGVGHEIADPSGLAGLRDLGLEPSGLGPSSRWVRLRPETITGRRFTWLEWSARPRQLVAANRECDAYCR
jgi:uncharacterized protein